jgi:DNA-binding transcriptional ArsR family regulator
MTTIIQGINPKQFQSIIDFVRASKHPLRCNIANFIMDEAKTVTEIFINFRLEQSVVSQHLAILRKAGIVKTKRDGKYMFYSVDKVMLDKFNVFIDNLYPNTKK